MPYSTNAHDEGRNAFLAGKSIASCDYTMSSYLGLQWRIGYIRERNDCEDAIQGIEGKVRHV